MADAAPISDVDYTQSSSFMLFSGSAIRYQEGARRHTSLPLRDHLNQRCIGHTSDAGCHAIVFHLKSHERPLSASR